MWFTRKVSARIRVLLVGSASYCLISCGTGGPAAEAEHTRGVAAGSASPANSLLRRDDNVLTAVPSEGPCATVTDQYSRMVQVPVGQDTVGICIEMAEPTWDSSGDIEPAEVRSVHPFRSGPDGGVVYQVSHGQTRLFTTVTGYEEEVGQATWQAVIWFVAQDGYHLFQRCQGGRLCAPSITRYTRVTNGAVSIYEICYDGCEMIDPQSLSVEGAGDTTEVNSTVDRFFEDRPLPPAILRLIEEHDSRRHPALLSGSTPR